MKRLFALSSLIGVLLLAGCGGGSGSGAETTQNQDTTNNSRPDEIVYNGPDPVSSSVQQFQSNVWNNLNPSDRCGECHDTQPPTFTRFDDINLAYEEVIDFVNLESPAESGLVTQVASGHFCWRPELDVCVSDITRFISNWAQSSGSVANEIVLMAPTLRDVGGTQNFPSSANDTLFETTVYPLTREFCGVCHAEDSPLQQQPFIGSADVQVAFDAARSRIDLTTPRNSRLVTRLRSEFHNCWSDCLDDARAMQSAIEALSDDIPVTEVNPELVISRALNLVGDGISSSAGGRVETDAIAIWDFSRGEGSVAADRSGISPVVDLSFTGDVTWVGSNGIDIGPGGRAQALTASSSKLYDLITATGEFSVEAWVVPGNVTQEGPARIVSYSGSSNARNFMLGQTLYNYDFFTRSSTSIDANGNPAISTDDDAEVLQATLQHVVATFDIVEGRKLYVNGELVAEEAASGGNFNAWDSSFALVLGSEVGGGAGWEGIIRFLAIYNRAMPEEDILTNFDAGVGERYFLLFNVDEHLSFDDELTETSAYIAFEVSQFDDYSYLFSSPFFYVIGDDSSIGTINIEGMYIGVNGREASVGQAFANVSAQITEDNYEPGVGYSLSNLGTIVPLEFGSGDDVFFLSFDSIGNSSYDRPVAAAPVPPTPEDSEPVSDIGLKNFAEINETLSAATGVPITNSTVASVYEVVVQQMPSDENISGFVSAHQTGITQLAVAYCGEMAAAASPLPARDQLIDDLLDALLANSISRNGGEPLLTQPHPDIASEGATNSVREELVALYDRISASATESDAVIATCAALTGSAITLIQ